MHHLNLNYLAATLHTLGARLTDTVHEHRPGDRDRGSVTIDTVIWAVAVIVIAGIVVAAVKAYVTAQAGKIH